MFKITISYINTKLITSKAMKKKKNEENLINTAKMGKEQKRR